MEQDEDDQWSWWQQNPDATSLYPPVAGDGSGRAELLADAEPSTASTMGEVDNLRKGLIGLVAVLSVALAGASYQRWGGDPATAVAAGSTTTTTAPTPEPAPSTSVSSIATTVPSPTTSAPTTSISTTTTSAVPTSPSTTTAVATPSGGPPGVPLDVEVVSTGTDRAEIRWRSEECVGSRYQVGDFKPGGGGYPDVDRCWFNHVILAGDPSFSPPLSAGTTYTVRIQAVAPDGTPSDPVEIEFTTSS